MKKNVVRYLILTVLFGIIFGCTNSLEKDAQNLADIQEQKNETVRMMLGCKDSIQKLYLLEEITRLENQFKRVRQTYADKYADSAAQRAFETYYRIYLSKISN